MPHSQKVAFDFATSIGLDSQKLQTVIDYFYVFPDGDRNITIYVDKDDTVYLTIHKANERTILDRAHFIKKNDDWEEITNNN